MKIFIYANSSKSLAALAAAIENFGSKYDLECYFKPMRTIDHTTERQCMLNDQDLSELQTSDAILTFGTWGSDHCKRQWNIDGIKFNQGFKELVNKTAIRLAKGSNIPHLVSETATLSRIRTNYTSENNFKKISPGYYRLGLNHWTYGKTLWCQPNINDNTRLDLLNQNLNQRFGQIVDFENHTWRNITDNSGRIWILPGLEQDPTSVFPVKSWVIQTVERIQEITNRQINIKPHPLSSIDFNEIFKTTPRVQVIKDQRKPLSDFYEKMYCAVVDNSTSVFELVDAGIPVFCGQDSFARDLKNTNIDNIENIYYANKQEYLKWAQRMSYTEFNLNEWQSEEIFPYLISLVNQGKQLIDNGIQISQ